MHTHTRHTVRTTLAAFILAVAALLASHGTATAYVLEGTGIDSTWPGTPPAADMPGTTGFGGGPQEL